MAVKKQKREYTLYTAHPKCGITNQSKLYRSGMFVCHVKATSIKQAYYLLANSIVYNDNKKIGITAVDNSHGPEKGFPFPAELYPKHWGV